MIGYVTLGTNDLKAIAPFYDAIAAEMGVGRMMEFDSFIAWGEIGGAAGIARGGGVRPGRGAGAAGRASGWQSTAKGCAEVDQRRAVACRLAAAVRTGA